jgi:RNA polymerase sigma-70 factor (ECF subfamily)
MYRVKSGDPEVLRRLLALFLNPLQRYAGTILSRPEDAEEAVQEAFVRLWEKREAWREDGSIQALLFTLTRNAAIDTLRKRRRETPLEGVRLRAVPTPGPTPFETAHEGELWALAEAAIRKLPPRRQEVFRLVREGGLSYREVSCVLGISPQTVANLMSLALTNLRSTLAPLFGEADDFTVRVGRQRESGASGSD